MALDQHALRVLVGRRLRTIQHQVRNHKPTLDLLKARRKLLEMTESQTRNLDNLHTTGMPISAELLQARRLHSLKMSPRRLLFNLNPYLLYHFHLLISSYLHLSLVESHQPVGMDQEWEDERPKFLSQMNT